jgi:hypothetical protein
LVAICLLISTFALANTYTVTNTNPFGPGSLDQAIIDANTNPGADVITFNITGTGPFVIAMVWPGLTTITDAVTIDGYSQPGSTQGSMATRVIQIAINGTGAGGSVSGLTINSNNVTIDGLNINSFGLDGINVMTGVTNLFFWGNFIGTDPTGFVKMGNSGHGINLGDGGPGGNDVVIIGTNSDGTNDANEGNLISGSGQDGIAGWALTNSIISGNFIGSDRTGTGTTFGNLRNGILLTVNSDANRIGSNGDNVNDVQELNGIISNGAAGISLAANSNGNVVGGNIVGINTAGAAAGNGGNGIELVNSSNNRIGIDVTTANFNAERNIVSGNSGNGISLVGLNFFGNTDFTTGNIVQGNYVGTTPNNDSRGNLNNGINLGSADGVGVQFNLIGSDNDDVSDAAEGNIIAHNSIYGIGTDNTADITANIFSRNSFYSNSNLGIDLGGNGITPNDNGDGDTGPNDYYNFPVITNSFGDGTNLTITGISGLNAIIEVYVDDGSRQGKTFLFRAQEGANLNGIPDILTGTSSYSDPTFGTFTDENFQFVVPIASIPFYPPGSKLVALAIDPNTGSTSEFGPSALLLPITLSSFKGQLVDGTVKLSWTSSREINFSHFVVEKSLDGITYTAIGTVKGGSVNGQYSFIDGTPLGKANYYRLQQVDLNGTASYSKALLIRNDVEGLTVKISPNPATTYLNVSFKLDQNEVVKLSIYDQLGRVTKRYSLQGSRGINVFNISDLNNLPAGNYVVELKGETVSAKEKIVKN